VTNEIVSAISSYYNAYPSAPPLTLNDLLGYSYGHISQADLNFIRALGVTNAIPALDTDEWIFEMAARLGPRTEYGYREWAGNLTYPGVCENGFSQASFFAETDSSWNALPGDALFSINPGHPLAGLFSATNIAFTHAGMATGPNGVRHNTSYSDYMGGFVEEHPDAPFGDYLARLNPDWLAYSSPGTLTENLDGTFCKTDPDYPGTCSNDPDQIKRRDFAANSTLLLTTANPTHRGRLKNVLEWALGTEKLYGVYGFSNGAYGNGEAVCSSFVRDALLSEYSGNEFDNSITQYNIRYVDLKALGFIYYDANGNEFAMDTSFYPSLDGNPNHHYNTGYKSFFYKPGIRAHGANYLYDEIFNSISSQVNQNLEYNFWSNLFKEGMSKQIRKQIATQLVNCFAYGEPCNDLTAPSEEPDPDGIYSHDNLKPVWNTGDLTRANHPEEGWAFSADDLLYLSSPYDTFEKLIRIGGQIINTEYCTEPDNPATCTALVSQMCNQSTGYDMLTHLPCQSEADLVSCAADGPVCECIKGQTCACASNSDAWLQLNTSIHTISKKLYKEFDNDRLDGNSKSIAGFEHGPYTQSYTVETDQTITFTPYHDRKDYPNIAPDQNLEDPPVMKKTTRDIDGAPVEPVYYPVNKGDQVSISLTINYFLFDTEVTWKIKKNNSHLAILKYRLPHTSENPVTSLYRAFELKYSPWVFQ
jgi:hypothetical protein